jgi:phosphonate transport system permease protein
MIIMATILVQFDWIAVIIKLPKVIERFFELYFPMDFEDLSKMLEALLFTIMLAIASSFTGIFIGFPFALMISKKTNNNKIVSEIARFIATIFRVIPPGIWALIFIFVFWFGYFLAYLVLTLYSFGFLARTFAEVFDETNPNCIEALKTTGASYSQIIFHGVIPEVMPSVVSWSLYDIENNIRNSTIIGLLTGAGLGYLISIYRHFREFESLIVAVLLVVITIILIDNLAMQIRKRILS